MYVHVLVLQITMLGKTVGEGRGVSRGPEEKPGICCHCFGIGLYWGNKVKCVGFTLLFYFPTPCCQNMKYNHRQSNWNYKWDFKVSYKLKKKNYWLWYGYAIPNILVFSCCFMKAISCKVTLKRLHCTFMMNNHLLAVLFSLLWLHCIAHEAVTTHYSVFPCQMLIQLFHTIPKWSHCKGKIVKLVQDQSNGALSYSLMQIEVDSISS